MHVVDGWLLLVSLSVNDVLFKLVFGLVAVGWQLWISWMVVGMLLSLVVGDGLFKLALWRSVVVDGRLFGGGGWHEWVSFVVVGRPFTRTSLSHCVRDCFAVRGRSG